MLQHVLYGRFMLTDSACPYFVDNFSFFLTIKMIVSLYMASNEENKFHVSSWGNRKLCASQSGQHSARVAVFRHGQVHGRHNVAQD